MSVNRVNEIKLFSSPVVVNGNKILGVNISQTGYDPTTGRFGGFYEVSGLIHISDGGRVTTWRRLIVVESLKSARAIAKALYQEGEEQDHGY